jgi:DNA-directed RNA polymerase specialized sigma24 family protein
MVAWALGRPSAPAEFVLQQPAREDDPLERLVRTPETKLQVALLGEALALLDDDDRFVIALRLDGTPYERIAQAIGGAPDTAGARFALAVGRLGERMAFVSALERRGISPPERQVLGQVRFFGRSAQDVARRLRLNPEAVERWVRLSGLAPPPGHGARS